MTLLPNGRTASFRADVESSAKNELRRITAAYVDRIRDLYKDLPRQERPKVAVAMRELQAAVLAFWMRKQR